MADTTVNGSPVTSPSYTSSTSTRIPRPSRTRRRKLLTFADAVDRILRIEEINPSETRSVERAKLAVQSALRSFVSYATQGFRYYDGRYPLDIDAPISLAEITVASNVVTVTGWSSFPDWMEVAHLRVAGQSYAVTSFTATTFTVDGTLADGTYTSCYLEQMFFTLPKDFRRRGSVTDGTRFYPVLDVSPGILQSWQDYYDWARSVASPRVFGAIASDQRFQGDLMLAIWPPYATDTRLNMYYERYPASCEVHRVGSGTVNVTGTNATATASIFVPDHVGSVLVVGTSNDTDIVNSLSSLDLVHDQRVIVEYNSATSVTLDKALDSDVTIRSFYVSDPVDVQPGAQTEAFLRLCEYELVRQSRSKHANQRYKDFIDQLQIALADDSRYRESNDDSDGMGDGLFTIGDVIGRPDL